VCVNAGVCAVCVCMCVCVRALCAVAVVVLEALTVTGKLHTGKCNSHAMCDQLFD